MRARTTALILVLLVAVGGVVWLRRRAEARGLAVALAAAADQGDVGAVVELLQQGVDPNVVLPDMGEPPIAAAVRNKHLAAARALLDAGAPARSRDRAGRELLSTAVLRDDAEMVALLLERGAAPNVTARFGRTLLMRASGPGALVGFARRELLAARHTKVPPLEVELPRLVVKPGLEIVRLLVEAGAEVRARDSEQVTALHQAAADGRPETVRYLLQAGAEVEAADLEGHTPLFYALGRRHLLTLQTLLRAGANVNARDLHGYTPLHYASLMGEDALIQALLQAGADARLKTPAGLTPLAVVTRRLDREEKTARILRTAGRPAYGR